MIAITSGLERGNDLPDPYRQRRNPLRCVYGYCPASCRVRHSEDEPDGHDHPQERGKGGARVGVLPRRPSDDYGEDHDQGCCTDHAAIVRASQDQINPRAAWRGQNGNEETMTTSRTVGTPWSLGVRCDRVSCPVRFEGDFLVAEDALLGERLKVVLDHVRDKEGWQVIWPAGAGAGEAETYCPAHKTTGAPDEAPRGAATKGEA